MQQPSGGSSHRKRSREHYNTPQDSSNRRKESKRSRTQGGDQTTRRWLSSPNSNSNSNSNSNYKSRFVVVSYNILGVQNALNHPDLYHQVSQEHLGWGQRKKRLLKELGRYNSSILCLQEVDRFDDLANVLHGDGYASVYKGRTGNASDGCAIFWKEEQFTLLHQENIEYQKSGLRDNVAQLCLFKVCQNHLNASADKAASSHIAEHTASQTLLVGNIHLLFNPSRGDIKLGQVRLLLDRAHKISQQWGNSPVVICGDFNSMPQSAICQFLSSAELDILMYDRKKLSGQVDMAFRRTPVSTHHYASRSPFFVSNPREYAWSDEEIRPREYAWSDEEIRPREYAWSDEEIRLATGCRLSTCLENPLKLYSAYQGVPGTCDTRDDNGEPLVTSYHSKFMGTVDYIWHSSALVPLRVVETLPIKILKKLRGLPSKEWGSDHLALVCEFAFIDDSDHAINLLDS